MRDWIDKAEKVSCDVMRSSNIEDLYLICCSISSFESHTRKRRREIRTEEQDEEREAEARPEDDEIEEAKREVVESPRTLLATQAIPPDDDDILTRAVDITGLAVIAATPFLQSS